MARRLKGMGSAKYQNDGDPRTSGPGFGLTVHPDTLATPLSWRKPRKVFVNSMSDLFHKGVPTSFIESVFATMAVTPQHTYQVLTKRHGRMRSLLSSDAFFAAVAEKVAVSGEVYSRELVGWPLPNVWVGVSVEDQKAADLRIPALLDSPAAVRFLSCEPLLGPVDLTCGNVRPNFHGPCDGYCDGALLRGIDWLIAGGESGQGARPMHPDWARQLRDQGQAAGVAFHFKQRGSWTWSATPGAPFEPSVYVNTDGQVADEKTALAGGSWQGVWNVSKDDAGRELDGRTWDEFPAAVTP
jgi:protein gp37